MSRCLGDLLREQAAREGRIGSLHIGGRDGDGEFIERWRDRKARKATGLPPSVVVRTGAFDKMRKGHKKTRAARRGPPAGFREGRPCPHCEGTLRYVSSGKCVACNRSRAAEGMRASRRTRQPFVISTMPRGQGRPGQTLTSDLLMASSKLLKRKLLKRIEAVVLTRDVCL
jgi:hypothetical protein